MNDLRTSLHRVADAVEPLPVDDDLWQRGIAARRRSRTAIGALGKPLVLAAALVPGWSRPTAAYVIGA